MAEADFNKAVDEWIERKSKQVGQVIKPGVESWSMQVEVGLFGNIFHEFITTDTIRHYAAAMGDKNPLWRNNDYASKTAWGGIIALPTFTDCIGASWAGRSMIKEEHFRVEGEPSGPKRQWFGVIRPGDRFRIADKYLGLKEIVPKQPMPYRIFVSTIQRSFINQRDETVAVADCRNMTFTVPSGLKPTALFPGANRKRRKLTDKEREDIYRRYEGLKIRGAEPLYWEDVAVGDEIKPLVLGPVSTWDVAAFFTAVGGETAAFDILWDELRVNIDTVFLDNEVNAWKCPGEGHFCDNTGLAAAYTGGPGVAPGPQIDGLICRSICNWMGDDGFLKVLDTQYRNLPFLGDVYVIKGKVTNKSTEGDEHLVDLDASCENMDGLLLVRGSAKVRLPSRTQS